MERNYKIDNIRFFLIFCVVFGHLIRIVGFESLYRNIYIFHMPAFIFLLGYCARYDKKKILYTLLYPYLLLQIIYLVFNTLISAGQIPLEIQFTTPYWLLWFLWVAVLYYLCIPIIEGHNKFVRWGIIVCAVGISLLAGFFEPIGYYLSLSRFFTFLPYFIIGYYSGHGGISFQWIEKKVAKYTMRLLNITLLVYTGYFITQSTGIETKVLYGAFSYMEGSYTPGEKLILMLLAFNWILFLWLNVPSKKMIGISTVGRNTFSIFILHGFLIMTFKKYWIFIFTESGNLIFALLLTAIIITVFGNQMVGNFVKTYMTGQWIYNIQKKRKESD